MWALLYSLKLCLGQTTKELQQYSHLYRHVCCKQKLRLMHLFRFLNYERIYSCVEMLFFRFSYLILNAVKVDPVVFLKAIHKAL